MTNIIEAKAGALEEVEDAGQGPQGIVKRWLMELDLASKAEEYWRGQAKDANARYRDEKAEGERGGNYGARGSSTINSNRYASGNRYNILYSNVQTICPALFNQTPKPDVRRRYRDADKTGKVIADIMERGLSFTMDEYDFDRFMRLAVKDSQLTGRGVTRIKYEATFEKKDNDGEEYDEKVYDKVCWEHVNWADFRVGPGRTWEEVEWIAFRHALDKAELAEKFPKTYEDVQLDYSPQGIEEGDRSDPITDTFKRAVVWEIWDKAAKECIFIAPSLAERPLKKEDDPIGLTHFFPIPRPLYATENADSLVPVEPFRFYQDQANELDEITKRISGILGMCKVRGIYDSTMGELSTLMNANDGALIPATDVLPLMQAGGLEKAVWLWPIDKIVPVLAHLYQQREVIKSTIYEITGIADIMRGSSVASETLGAQQLKAQFGTMRLDDMRREVQRYARDLVRMAAEVMAEHFSPDTMAIMTEVQLPTNEQKQQAMMMGQQMQAQGQPLPDEFKEGMVLPTWEEALQVLRDDKQRAYRIDIETDSTIAGDQAAEQRAITELLTGIGAFINTAGPAVAAGYFPLDAAKSLLMTSVRRFKLGRDVEDALDMIGEDGEAQQGPNPQEQAMQQAQNEELQQLQRENEAMKADQSMRQQEMGQKAQLDQAKMQMDSGIKQAELALKEREIALKEIEAQKPKPAPDRSVDIMMARERMEFEASEANKQRHVELAKAVISKSDGTIGEGDAMNQTAELLAALTAPKVVVREDAEQMARMLEQTTEMLTKMIAEVMAETTAALTAPKVLVRDDGGNIVGSKTIISPTARQSDLTAPRRIVRDDAGNIVGSETITH